LAGDAEGVEDVDRPEGFAGAAGDPGIFALGGAPWESLQYYPLRDFWRDGKQMISA
jgi:hypothetical protein